MNDGYRPPGSDVRAPRSARSSVVAVLLGAVVVDLIGTLLIGGLLAIGWGIAMALRGTSQAGIEAAATGAGLVGASVVFGLLMSAAGGYVAARWARRRPVAHGAATGALSLLLTLPLMLLPGATAGMPTWLAVLSTLAVVPVAAAGGGLAGRRLARSGQP